MKKLTVLMMLATAMVSCGDNTELNQGEDLARVKDETIDQVKSHMRYFRDERTGLCYSLLISNSSSVRYVHNLTCVPCDSLKKISKVEKYNY